MTTNTKHPLRVVAFALVSLSLLALLLPVLSMIGLALLALLAPLLVVAIPVALFGSVWFIVRPTGSSATPPETAEAGMPGLAAPMLAFKPGDVH